MEQRQQGFFNWEAQSRDLIALRRSYVDLAGGDLSSGVLLSQLVYWHSPDDKGRSRLRVHKDGHWWVAKKREDWWDECRLTPKQFDRAAQVLEKLGLIVLKTFRFNGSPTKHIRINFNRFFQALDFVTQNLGTVFKGICNKLEVVRNSPKGENQLPKTGKSKSPKREKPTSYKGKFDLPQKGNSILTKGEVPITESTTETTTETSSPLTPQGEEKTEPNWLTETEELDYPNISAPVAIESDCLETELYSGEDPCSAPPPDNVKKSESSVRKYDPALGICPPEERKTWQQRQFDWVPDGPWLVDNKLDPNFVDWQARDWLKAYGGDLHKKRADVLRHFKKDAANLAIAWEQYRSEQHHRYSNAALRMQNGMQIQPDEQQQLWAHSRAITEALSEEINPIAVGQSGQWQQWDNPQLPAKVVAFPGRGSVTNDTSQDVRDQKSRTSAIGQVDDIPTFSNSTSSTPTNEEGNALNPDAYKVWQSEPVEGEPINPGEFRKKIVALTQNLSMTQPKKPEVQPKNELEELNQWLADPILRQEVMPRVMRSAHYTVEFNECGEAIGVVEV